MEWHFVLVVSLPYILYAIRMRIFAKLSRREVIGISAVCRRWRDVASCEPLWKHVELVSVAESLGDRELGLLAEKRLKVCGISFV